MSHGDDEPDGPDGPEGPEGPDDDEAMDVGSGRRPEAEPDDDDTGPSGGGGRRGARTALNRVGRPRKRVELKRRRR